MLQKGVYLYEDVDEWEEFDETSSPEKGNFCSQLNMEDITDADYAQVRRFGKDFKIKIDYC